MLAGRFVATANGVSKRANGSEGGGEISVIARAGRACAGSNSALLCPPVYADACNGGSVSTEQPARGAKSPRTGTAAAYIPRGPECAYANLKLISRVVSSVYDEALRPIDLRASQLALLWAIVALEPVDLGHLGRVTVTDQTTLSRTVEKLRQAKLVSVRTGSDRRMRIVKLTAAGYRRFEQAMPYWELAQQRAKDLLPLDQVRTLARRARRAAKSVVAAAPT